MNLDEHFRINTPKVVYETFDGEVIVINLDNGHYYSLTKAGATIWNLVIAGYGMQQVVQALSDLFDATPLQIEAGTRQFLADLAQEQLVLPLSSPRVDQTAPPGLAQAMTGTKPPFDGLEVQKFTDMEEMLLLDPIHEVDETGWPNVKRA